MRIIREFARYFVGALFIFSGIIKVNDPVGTAIKLEEYFQVFAYDFAPFFEWFIPAALFLSVFLSVLEVMLGIALIIGYKIRITSWVLLSLIIFFTFLTFYSAYFNKVTDCGCFGDAIKLTPWQSFFKDIILLLLIIVIFINKNLYQSTFDSRTENIIMTGDTAVMVFLCIWAIQHLPFVDFRSYAVGNSIPELMLPSGELLYEYVMEKDGEEFVFDTYPTDPSYTYKSMKVLNPEVQPKITDLAVWNDDGEYTDDLMVGTRLLVLVQAINKTSDKSDEKISTLLSSVKGVEIWSLTSNSGEEYESYAQNLGWNQPFYFVDSTVIKAMIRSSPGLILLKDGVVLGKWHYNDVPSPSEIARLL